MTKVLKSKSWTLTIVTLIIGLILPMINAQLPEDRQISEEFANNVIYVALGIGAIGAGNAASKRIRPNAVIASTYEPSSKPDPLPKPDWKEANPKAMSKVELEQMVADLQRQAKG